MYLVMMGLTPVAAGLLAAAVALLLRPRRRGPGRTYPGRGLDYVVARHRRTHARRRMWRTAFAQTEMTLALLGAVLLIYRLMA